MWVVVVAVEAAAAVAEVAVAAIAEVALAALALALAVAVAVLVVVVVVVAVVVVVVVVTPLLTSCLLIWFQHGDASVVQQHSTTGPSVRARGRISRQRTENRLHVSTVW